MRTDRAKAHGVGAPPFCRASTAALPPHLPCPRSTPSTVTALTDGRRRDQREVDAVHRRAAAGSDPAVREVWTRFRSALYNWPAKIEHGPADSNGLFTGKTIHGRKYGRV